MSRSGRFEDVGLEAADGLKENIRAAILRACGAGRLKSLVIMNLCKEKNTTIDVICLMKEADC